MGKYHFACKVTKNFAIYVMLLSIIMIMVPSLTAFASGEAAVRVEQNGNISLNVNKVPLKKVLSMIEKQSNYVFGYNSNTPNMNAPVTASLNNASISKVMNTVLSDTDLGYDISGRQVLIFKNNRNNKSIPIRGKVTDKNNEPLIGVTVMLKGSSTGAITDADGNFNINVPDEQSVLRVSFLGYVPQDIRVGNSSGTERGRGNCAGYETF